MTDVIGTYQEVASEWEAARLRTLFEKPWLGRMTAGLGRGARILDLGCGAGEPIAAYLIAQGFAVTGVDGAPAMIEICRTRWPGGDWRVADMRGLGLGERFDAVMAWNSFFHLTADEQREALPRIAAHVATGGRLMATVGPDSGDVTGTVAGRTVPHSSLRLSEYAALLEGAGMLVRRFTADDPDCSGHTVLLAERRKDSP